MFSSVWQQVMKDMVIVQNCSEQCVVKNIIVSKLTKSLCSGISVLTLDWFSRTPRRTNASIRSLSAGLTPPVECLSTDNYRGLAILNVCILILIMTTTEVTVGLVSR